MTLQIEAVVDIKEDHTVTLRAPDSVPTGPCRVVVRFQPQPIVVQPQAGPLTVKWQSFDVGPWPEGFTVGRDQIYGDDGR